MLIQKNKEICTSLGYERRQGNGDEVLLDRRSEEGILLKYCKYLVKLLEATTFNQNLYRRQWRGQPLPPSGKEGRQKPGPLKKGIIQASE